MSRIKCRTLWILRNTETGKFFRGIEKEDTGNKLQAQRYTSKPERIDGLTFQSYNTYEPEVLVEVGS